MSLPIERVGKVVQQLSEIQEELARLEQECVGSLHAQRSCSSAMLHVHEARIGLWAALKPPGPVEHMKDWHTDEETIAWLRRWPERERNMWHIEWINTALGYEQHMRFVDWLNHNGYGDDDIVEAALLYADKLERGEIPEFMLQEPNFSFGDLPR